MEDLRSVSFPLGGEKKERKGQGDIGSNGDELVGEDEGGVVQAIDEIEDEVDEEYDALIRALGSLEEPVFYAEKLEETLAECRRGNIRYISKGSFRRLFEEESRAENKSRAAPERAQPPESPPAGWHGVPLW